MGKACGSLSQSMVRVYGHPYFEKSFPFKQGSGAQCWWLQQCLSTFISAIITSVLQNPFLSVITHLSLLPHFLPARGGNIAEGRNSSFRERVSAHPAVGEPPVEDKRQSQVWVSFLPQMASRTDLTPSRWSISIYGVLSELASCVILSKPLNFFGFSFFTSGMRKMD